MDVHPAAFADFRRQRIGRRDGIGVGVEGGCESPARHAVEVMRRPVRARTEAVAISPQRCTTGGRLPRRLRARRQRLPV